MGAEVPRKGKKGVKGLAGVKFGKMLDANNTGLSLQVCFLPQVCLSVCAALPFLAQSLSFLPFLTLLNLLKKEGKLVHDSSLPIPPP